MSQDGIARFVIFSLARSGSSFLTSSLRSHPDVLCHGEALLPRHVPKHLHGPARGAFAASDVEADPAGFARRLLDLDGGHAAVGFKLFRTHSPEVHEGLLTDRGIHKIVLERENALASFSSIQTARETGKWDARRRPPREIRSAPSEIAFDPVSFDRYKEARDAYFNMLLTRAQGPFLRITYAEHIMTASLAPVLEFLGVDPEVRLTSTKKKQLRRNVPRRFSEPRTVKAHLEAIGRPDWAFE